MVEIHTDGGGSAADRRTSERKKLIIDVLFDGGDGTGYGQYAAISARAGVHDKPLRRSRQELQ
jgi:hypothetical protein